MILIYHFNTPYRPKDREKYHLNLLGFLNRQSQDKALVKEESSTHRIYFLIQIISPFGLF